MLPSNFRPMLAFSKTPDLDTLRYPLLASPKLDGIRCLITPAGRPVSRALKPIPSEWVNIELMGAKLTNLCLDGELMIPGQDFNYISSCFMSQRTTKDISDWEYHVFDTYDGVADFNSRLLRAQVRVFKAGFSRIKIVEHQLVNNADELTALHHQFLELGHEGTMVRDPAGKYKFGRSTLKEHGLIKIKEFHDAEAIVKDFEPLLHNANEAEEDAFGLTKRSHCKAGKVALEKLGALKCSLLRDPGVHFDIGSGFTDNQRTTIWEGRENYRGAVVKFKYQNLSADGVPRFPVFLGLRHKDDTA